MLFQKLCFDSYLIRSILGTTFKIWWAFVATTCDETTECVLVCSIFFQFPRQTKN